MPNFLKFLSENWIIITSGFDKWWTYGGRHKIAVAYLIVLHIWLLVKLLQWGLGKLDKGAE